MNTPSTANPGSSASTANATSTANTASAASSAGTASVVDSDGSGRTHTVVDSPVGPLTLVARNGALVGLYMDNQRHLPDRARFGEPDDFALPEAVGQLEEYFAGSRTRFELPLAMEGSAFQRQVWAALCEIPYGETISYGELARRIGNPAASRAVGLANGRNPIGIIVPCHRVIGASGSLTGYGGGLARKQHLLAFEQQTAGYSLL